MFIIRVYWIISIQLRYAYSESGTLSECLFEQSKLEFEGGKYHYIVIAIDKRVDYSSVGQKQDAKSGGGAADALWRYP